MCWPAHSPSQCLSRYILRPSLPLIASPRVCRLVLDPGESSHQPQSSHCFHQPRPSPCLCRTTRLHGHASALPPDALLNPFCSMFRGWPA
ncbi:hypothetical protein E2C01_081044 [Portunus trituberculatus]|uniref:Uncharacterized protein n=1 Tax=Portunus trituberculatus TaxID=210409 RepID=A0A5B7IV75_PORTR|nr:hypothetical protein [Portunus trituberculatus]